MDDPALGFFPVEIRAAGPCRVGVPGFMLCRQVESSEGYGHGGHGGPGVCLGDGQAEAEGVPSQGGRGDALLRRMSPYLT